jgi:hypothetical protein
MAQEKDIGLATAHKAVQEKLNLFPHKVTVVQELNPTPFISAQRLSECTVYDILQPAIHLF